MQRLPSLSFLEVLPPLAHFFFFLCERFEIERRPVKAATIDMI